MASQGWPATSGLLAAAEGGKEKHVWVSHDKHVQERFGHVEKDLEFKSVFRTGVEYHVVDPIFIRCGISNNPSMCSFGFGLRQGLWQFDIASSYHQDLGFSPQVSLLFNK